MIKIFFYPLREAVIPVSTGELPDPNLEKKVKGLFAESLLIGDKITLGIRGPNLQIVTLFRWLSKELVEKLIEEDIINFIFAPGVIIYFTLENLRKLNLKKPGLRVWKVKGKHWDDIFYATDFALKEQTNFIREYRRYIARLISKHTVPIKNEEVYNESFEISKDDIRGEIGKELGFENIEDPDSGEIPIHLQRKYLSVANSNVSIYLAASTNCNELYGDEMTSNILTFRLNNLLKVANKNINNFRLILKFEKIPNFSHLLDMGKVNFEDIIKLRTSKDAKRFREWLSKIDSNTSMDTLGEYCKNSFKPFFKTRKFKGIKTTVFIGIGAALAPFSPVIGASVGGALSILDFFLFDVLLKGWSPKVFINELKSL